MAKHEYVNIQNISKQMIGLQVKPNNGDFFIEERQIRINPGKTVRLLKDFLLWSQVTNLQARHILRVK